MEDVCLCMESRAMQLLHKVDKTAVHTGLYHTLPLLLDTLCTTVNSVCALFKVFFRVCFPVTGA